MARAWVNGLGLWLVALLLSVAAAWGDEPPKAVAFVVGVQSYDAQGLDELRYTIRDAEDVFERLRAVTDLDLERSRLLLADPEAPDEGAPGDPWVRRERRLELEELQSELTGFLDGLEDDDTVMFYFGGHGTVQAQRYLLFLPSDYSPEPRSRYWRYNTIIEEIEGRINEGDLRNVSVVFFANMCGSGSGAAGDVAMSAQDDEIERSVREWLDSNTLDFQRFAFFPASAPNRNTFEKPDLGRSLFAHHLLEGLRGGAAKDGVITAGSLFEYLDAKIDDALPRNPETFDSTIPIGITREIEARGLYLDGLALTAEALETDDPLFWELAERDFEGAANFSEGGRLWGMATLRLAQVRAARGGDPAEVTQLLAPLAESADPDIRDAARRLLDLAGRAPSERFVAVLLTEPGDVGRSASDIDVWRMFLEDLPGHVDTRVIELTPNGGERGRSVQILDALVDLKRELGGDGDLPHLVLSYSGSAGFSPEGRMVPLPVDVYTAALRQWGGEATLIYDAPFGGFLEEAWNQGLLGDSTLVLAAHEKNGMTFTDSSSARLLIDMIEEGVDRAESWEPFERHRQGHLDISWRELPETERELYGATTWVVGTPAILRSRDAISPVFQPTNAFRQEAVAGLGPVRRLASLIAAGCDMDPSCEGFAPGPLETALDQGGPTAALERLGADAPAEDEPIHEVLKRAALLDFGGDLIGAYDLYLRFLGHYEEAHRDAGGDAPAGEEELRSAAWQSLDRLVAQVRNRTEGLQGKLMRQVRLLVAPVPDYDSPLVPDLVGPAADAEAWERALRELRIWSRPEAEGGELPVEVSRLDTSSRARFLDTLDEALGQAGPEDLVVLVFSGRGVEIDGERYLGMADAKPAPLFGLGWDPLGIFVSALPSEAEPVPSSAYPTAIRGWVSLTEVAERAGDRWFLGIYDTQFTAPVFDPERTDGLLDKHIDSVRPLPPEALEAELAAPDLERFVAGSGGDTGKHVHIWWEGRLTERLGAPPDCQVEEVGGVRSPMSAGLLAVLWEQPLGTYRDWVERAQANACLGTATGFGLVAQGAVDLPRFASGEAAARIPFFLGAGERRDVNLHVGEYLATTAAEGGDDPLFVLSRAAVRIARTGFDRSNPIADRDAQAGRLDEVAAALGPMLRSQRVEDAGLGREALDLYTRALELDGDDDLARKSLLDAPPERLSSAALQDRLVRLTEAELLQSPSGIIERTQAKLDAMGQAGAGPDPEILGRFRSVAAEFEEPRRQYRIVPTPASPE